MPTLRSEALVLRSVDYSEADRILHLLVPEVGRLTAIAKHARRSKRRFGGTLDLFNRLEVEIALGRGSAMSRLDRAPPAGTAARPSVARTIPEPGISSCL